MIQPKLLAEKRRQEEANKKKKNKLAESESVKRACDSRQKKKQEATGDFEEELYTEKVFLASIEDIVKVNRNVLGEWRPINAKWLFDVYVIQTALDSPDQEKMNEEFLNQLEIKHKRFHGILMKKAKLMSFKPIAPLYQFMDPLDRPDGKFDPTAFTDIFHQCLERGDIIEDSRMMELLDRLYNIFNIPNDQRDVIQIDQKALGSVEKLSLYL